MTLLLTTALDTGVMFGTIYVVTMAVCHPKFLLHQQTSLVSLPVHIVDLRVAWKLIRLGEKGRQSVAACETMLFSPDYGANIVILIGDQAATL